MYTKKRLKRTTRIWLVGVCIFLLCVMPTAAAPVGPEGIIDEPCIAPDDGTGTVDLPSNSCDYSTPIEPLMIIDGLPPGTVIYLTPILTDYFCPLGICGIPGGNLGGEVQLFDANLILQVRSTGDLDGFRRNLRVPVSVETHSGPRVPGDPVQSFDMDMQALIGGLPPGDPDFAELVIISGTGNGMPSPGHTTLTELPSGDFLVDSYFDVTYHIDFVGAPGGALDGLSGSTTAMARTDNFRREPKPAEFDNGDGTITLPPLLSHYKSLNGQMEIIDGLPPGTTITIEPTLHTYICTGPNGVCGQAGGDLGGERENFNATLNLILTGNGDLAGFNREINIPVAVETFSAPRGTLGQTEPLNVSLSPLSTYQTFATAINSLQGDIFGDPDFDSLLITAGYHFSLPSPGHTTLYPLPDGNFFVDSFFDITYQIDFVGAPGGALDGLSGATQGVVPLMAFHDLFAKPYKTWFPLLFR